MSLSAFSIDITLPLFSKMADGLNSPLELMPFTITSYLACLGVGQILFGVLSDAWGRRPLLIAGFLLFIASGLVAAVARELETLLIARAVQGLGAAGPYIVSRAIIRDMYQGVEMAQKMAIATGIFSIGPLLAPLLSASVLELGGSWRWVFFLMAGYATVLFIMVPRIPETNTTPDRDAYRFTVLINNTAALFGNRQSCFFIAINAVISVSLFLMLASTAPLYANIFNISGSTFALYFAIHGLGIIIGQFGNHRLIGKIGIVQTSIVAAVIMISSMMLVIVITFLGWLAPWLVSVCLIIFAIGFLSVVANSISLVLQPHGNIVGFAVAMQGLVSMVFAGLVSSILAIFVQENIYYWALAIAASPILVLIGLLYWRKRTVGPGRLGLNRV